MEKRLKHSKKYTFLKCFHRLELMISLMKYLNYLDVSVYIMNLLCKTTRSIVAENMKIICAQLSNCKREFYSCPKVVLKEISNLVSETSKLLCDDDQAPYSFRQLKMLESINFYGICAFGRCEIALRKCFSPKTTKLQCSTAMIAFFAEEEDREYRRVEIKQIQRINGRDTVKAVFRGCVIQDLQLCGQTDYMALTEVLESESVEVEVEGEIEKICVHMNKQDDCEDDLMDRVKKIEKSIPKDVLENSVYIKIEMKHTSLIPAIRLAFKSNDYNLKILN